MINDTFKRALRTGGWTAFGIALAIGFLTLVSGFVIIGRRVLLLAAIATPTPSSEAVTSLLSSMMLFMAVGSLVGLISQAGLLGSYHDAVEGSPVTLGSYLSHGFRYCLPLLGYSLLYGLLLGVIYGLVAVVLALAKGTGVLLMVMFLMPFGVVFSLFGWIMPSVYLSTIGYESTDFVAHYFWKLGLVGLLVTVIALVPILGSIIAMGCALLFPLLVISLAHEYQNGQFDDSF